MSNEKKKRMKFFLLFFFWGGGGVGKKRVHLPFFFITRSVSLQASRCKKKMIHSD
jgi:hypothetical protein